VEVCLVIKRRLEELGLDGRSDRCLAPGEKSAKHAPLITKRPPRMEKPQRRFPHIKAMGAKELPILGSLASTEQAL
jgi:hypothetical protein